MVLFNYSTKELTAKIVYYGPGLCGKTTNLQFIYDSLPGSINKGKMLSLATKTDRTLFFDFLPIDLGMIRGMRTRLQLYTVPGQVFYNTTRKLVLKGADGVVFVADSQKRMVEANLESFKNLEENLQEHGMKLGEMPLVIQFNKRDLPEALGVEELNAKINRFNAPIYEGVATTGIGVHETLKAITRLVLNSLKEKYAERKELRTEPPAAVKAAMAARAAVSSQPASAPPQPTAASPFTAAPSPAPVEPPRFEPPAPAAPAAAASFMESAPRPEHHAPPAALPEPFLHDADGAEMPEPEPAIPEPFDAGPLAMEEELPELDSTLPEIEIPEAAAGTSEAPEPLAAESLTLDHADSVELTLELAEEAPAAGDSASDLLELPAIDEIAPPVDVAEDPLVDSLPAASHLADPLELPDLAAADSLDMTDEIPVTELPDELPIVESTVYDPPPASRLAPEPAPRASRTFSEDRSSLVLEAFEGPPVELARPTAVTGPNTAAAPVTAREIAIPLQLSVGEQQIQFEIRITLDLLSGQPRLVGADATERSAS